MGIMKEIARLKSSKFTSVCYMTYVLNFPDGDTWVKQTEFNAHSLEMELKNLMAQHAKDKMGRGSEWRNRAMALWKAGETWWKDNLGVEHLILIESKKRPKHQLRWGIDKKGLGGAQHGITEDPWANKTKIVKG